MSDWYSTEPESHAPDVVDESIWRAILKDVEHEAGPMTAAAARPPSHAAPPAAPMDTTADWTEAYRLMELDSVLTLTVADHNRGGLLVNWRSLRGFVPASQLVSYVPGEPPQALRAALAARMGEALTLRIIEIDPAKRRLILSERAAQVASGTRTRLLEAIRPGDVLEGRITNLVDFGAFADLGGVEGLIHISELSWGRVTHPADLLQRGQVVRVYVMDIHPEASRIALSIKRLRPDPWATVEQRYRVGETIEATITNVVDFGAFACIEEGLEGLIHFSELAEGHFLHPRNVVREGERIRARILHIDGKARRLGLTLRQM